MVTDKLGQILLRAGCLDQAGLQRAVAEQQRSGGSLGEQLVRLRLISDETLIRALSTQYHLPAVVLDAQRVNLATARLIPQELCVRYHVVCFRTDTAERVLDVALADPGNAEAIAHVTQVTSCQLRLYIAAAKAIDEVLRHVFDGRGTHVREPALSSAARHPSREPSAQRIEPLSQDSRAAVERPMAEPPLQLEVNVRPVRGADRLPAVTAVSLEAVDPAGTRPTCKTPAFSGSEQHRVSRDAAAERPSVTDEHFHITMDLPAVDKAALAAAKPHADQRLNRLESATARETGVLRQLVSVLLRKGVLTRAEVDSILRE